MLVDFDKDVGLDARRLCQRDVAAHTGGHDDEPRLIARAVRQQHGVVRNLGNLRAGDDVDARLLAGSLQHCRRRVVELPRQEAGRGLKHGNVEAALLEFPAALKTHDAAADDDGFLRALCHDLLRLLAVGDGADRNDVRLVRAGDGHDEATRAKGVDQLVVGKRAFVGDDFLRCRVDGLSGGVKHQFDVALVVPRAIFNGEAVAREVLQQHLGQHRAVVGQMALRRDDLYFRRGVAVADRFRGEMRARPAAKDNKGLLRILAEIGSGVLHGHKLIAADAADGTGVHGRVKNRAADEALHQAASTLAAAELHGFRLALHQLAAKVVAVFVGVQQLCLAGLEPHAEAFVGHVHAQLAQTLDEVRHALAAPAVAAERAGELAAVDGRKQPQRQVPDGRKRLAEDGGRAQQERVALRQLRAHRRGVGGHHIVIPDLRLVAAGVRDARADAPRQFAGVAVGVDVGDDHQLLVPRRGHRAPLAVERDDLVDVAVMHRTVACADHVELQVLDTVQRVIHERMPERAYDVVEVILGRAEVALCIRHSAAKDALVAVVTAKRVAGEQHAVLLDIGVHRIRPVELGQDHKAQRLAAQRQRVAVLHRAAVEVVVDDLLQEAKGGGGADDHGAGIELQHLFDGAGVIRLRVIHHNVVDGVYGRNCLDILHILIPEFELVGLKEGGLFAPLEHVGVVGRAEFRVHDDVKHAEVGVQNAIPPQAVSQLHRFHGYSSLIMY